MERKKKFVASYSGGKDSILAVYRAIKEGYVPLKLITTYDMESDHSWFHNIQEEMLEKVCKAVNIPLLVIKASGESYASDFEKALTNLKDHGAEVCIFGDIDIQEHRDWCVERCENVGIESYFPLWNEARRDLVFEFIDEGFKAMITVVNTTKINEKYLGKVLAEDVVNQISLDGADICGENGEYHTFVFDGPIFAEAVDFHIDEIVKSEQRARLTLRCNNEDSVR